MRLAAHFGQWLTLGRRGRNTRRWQVAAGLIYGQVKKSYQRRKLVRVTHVMRLGTEAALQATLQELGLSGRLNTAFIERVNLTVRDARGRAGPPDLGDGAAVPAAARPSGVVARVLPFCASSRSAAGEARAAARTRGQASGATLSAPYPCHGRRQNEATMDGKSRCFLAPCRRFLLESYRSQLPLVRQVAGKLVKVPAKEVGRSLT